MKKIYNDIIPFKDFVAMTLWPLLFIRKSMAWTFTDIVENHEEIHGRQQREMLAVGCVLSAVLLMLGCGWWSTLALPMFLWWYCTEWIVKLCYYRNAKKAYKNISTEREAYANQNNIIYLEQRKPFAWVNYIYIKD